jgi:hypothetical protein
VRRAHAVADEEDDVPRLTWTRAVDLPLHGRRTSAVGGHDGVWPRLSQGGVADEQRRRIGPGFFRHELPGVAQGGRVVGAVDRDAHRARVDHLVKLDFEVEPRADQDRRAVDRIYGRGSGGRDTHDRAEHRDEQESFEHGRDGSECA